MSTETVRHISPEEELSTRKEELTALRAELVDRELFLTNLRTELAAFEARYLREVGLLYAELDEWNAKIAELFADETGTAEARVTATKARNNAKQSYSAAHGEAANAKEFIPSAKLKSLFREVSKRVHPDFATSDADRVKRDQFMAEAIRAYQQGDADALGNILEAYESCPESVQGTGIEADLLRVTLQIKQISRRLAQIEAEVTELTSTDLAKLMAKVESACGEGRYPLAELAENVRKQIDAARSIYKTQSSTIEPA